MREMANKYGQEMRDRAMAQAKKRKEDFLGARVPKGLRDKVIQSAEEQGISVSILIRRILEKAFEGETAPSVVATQASQQQAPVDIAQRFPSVLGWDSITLNQGVSCSACRCALSTGSHVTLGLSATGGSPIVLCDHCKGPA